MKTTDNEPLTNNAMAHELALAAALLKSASSALNHGRLATARQKVAAANAQLNPSADPLDNIPFSGMNNELRADFGARAVRTGNPDHEDTIKDLPPRGMESSISDTLANIMHFCKREGIEWQPRLTMAEIHFNEECDEEEEGKEPEPEEEPYDSPSLEDTMFNHADPINR